MELTKSNNKGQGKSFNKEDAMRKAANEAQQVGARRASAISVACQVHHGLGNADKMIEDAQKILDYIEGKYSFSGEKNTEE